MKKNTKPMTRKQEDAFLDNYPELPNNERVTPAEQRLITQYGKIWGAYAHALGNDQHLETANEGGKTA